MPSSDFNRTPLSSAMQEVLRGYSFLSQQYSFTITKNMFDRKEALRSILVAQHFGARHVALFQHTDCGRLRFTTSSLQENYKTAFSGIDEAATAVEQIDDFGDSTDIKQSLKEDVAFLRGHPLIFKDTVVTGWIYDVDTGKASTSRLYTFRRSDIQHIHYDRSSSSTEVRS